MANINAFCVNLIQFQIWLNKAWPLIGFSTTLIPPCNIIRTDDFKRLLWYRLIVNELLNSVKSTEILEPRYYSLLSCQAATKQKFLMRVCKHRQNEQCGNKDRIAARVNDGVLRQYGTHRFHEHLARLWEDQIICTSTDGIKWCISTALQNHDLSSFWQHP